MAKIGLVTVLYNSNDVLEGFFESLSIQTCSDYHLYMVDNSPSTETDGLVQQLLSRFSIPQYSHIRNNENTGVAKGNNIGIKAALAQGCEYVLLLNNDIEFYQVDLFEKMIATAVEKNEAIIIPKIFYYGSRKIWMAGGNMHLARGYASHVGDGDDDSEKYNKAVYFKYAPTCFMLINKSVFQKIGLMDEQYFVYFDDTDFVYRAIKVGYKIFYSPQIEIFHKVSSSTGNSQVSGPSIFSIYYNNRNRIYFIRKHYNFAQKLVAFSYTFTSRAIVYLTYDKAKKRTLKQAIRDGLSMNV